MDFNNMFQTLYDMAIGLIEVIGSVWDWLSKPLKHDIFLFSDLPLIGDWFKFEFKYSPLEFLGIGILVLLALWVIKHLIPLG